MERIPPHAPAAKVTPPAARQAQQTWLAQGTDYRLQVLCSYYLSGTYRSITSTATLEIIDPQTDVIRARMFFGDPNETLAFLDDYYTSNGGTPLLPEGLIADWEAMDALIQAWAATLDAGN